MALISNSGAGSVAANPVQVSIVAALNTTMYIVPENRKFVGYFYQYGNWQIIINGVQITSATSLGTTAPIPITLVAGDVVSCGGSYQAWSMSGIELDLGATLDQI